ncbi:MAG: hypothetical protein LBQ07_00610 [Endomicrobium sp.]|jgi:hypothetical protein|nr:hypothetical protein [Endomicrobium sp.]
MRCFIWIQNFCLTFVLVLSLNCSIFCEVLTFNNYLDNVIKDNPELKSIQLDINATLDKLSKIKIPYLCFLNMELKYDYNSDNILTNYLKNFNCDISINKQFISGTKFSVIFGCLLNQNRYNCNNIIPLLQLQQSLLKEMKNKFTTTKILLDKTNAYSNLYFLEYKKQNVLLKAKFAYWDLSYFTTAIDFIKTSLNRSIKILELNRKKYNMNLIDKSDLLQSEIAVKMKELKLKLACDDENTAIVTLNTFLNTKYNLQFKYNIEKIESETEKIKKNDESFKKENMRFDVLAVLEHAKSTLYEKICLQKDICPDLILDGQFTVKQNNNSKSRPFYSINLRYIYPIDFKFIKTVNNGYELAQISAEKYAESMIIQETNDWFKLMEDLHNTKLKLDIAIEIEKKQYQKYEEDKKLLERGRCTTYQILQSEQELSDASLNILKYTLEFIKIREYIKTFYGPIVVL